MNEKIEIMGISADTCSVEEIIDSINAHWNQKDSLSTYGVLNMKLLMAAQKDEELKAYIEMLDKTVADETEVLQAAGIEDRELEQETSQHGFMGSLFWLLGQFTRNYTQTVKRAADNKRRYAPGWVHSTCLLRGFPKGAAPHLAHDFAEQSVVCYTLCRRCRENAVAAGEGKGI